MTRIAPYFLLFILFCLLAAPSLLSAQTKFYASMQYRSTQWNFLSFDQSEVPNDLFRSSQESFKTIDLSIRTGNNWKIGMLLDVGDFSDDISGYALRFGNKKWGFLMEKGKIAGHYQATSANTSLSLQQYSTFNSEYNMYAIYKEDYWINSGIAYIKYSAPLPTYFQYDEEVNFNGFSYTQNSEFSYIDRKSRMDIIGWYVATDALKTYMRDKMPLLDFGLVQGFFDIQYVFGLGISTPSESDRSLVENDVQHELEYKAKKSYLATAGGLSLGLMKIFETSTNNTLGISAGYQGRSHGAADISFSEPEDYTPDLGVGYFDVIHGFFIRASYMW